MSTSELQRVSNRENAALSTGPKSVDGKARAALNSVRHGLLSQVPVLAHEDPAEYEALQAQLAMDLRPVGILECALVERIGLSLWRQRRLALAEGAIVSIELSPRKLVGGFNSFVGYDSYRSIEEDEVHPADPEVIADLDAMINEMAAMDIDQAAIDHEYFQKVAPKSWQRWVEAAEEDQETLMEFLGSGAEAAKLLRQDLHEMIVRVGRLRTNGETVQPVLDLLKKVHSIPDFKQRDSLGRYRTQLDNELQKAIKTFREQQAWRLNMLEAVVASDATEAGIPGCSP